jgi:hypothetical protein
MPKAKWKGQICKYTRPHVRLLSPVNSISPLSISSKKYHIIFIPQACSGPPHGQGRAGRSGARDGRGGGRASSPTGATARHTGEHLLPTKRAATASRRSVLSSAVAWCFSLAHLSSPSCYSFASLPSPDRCSLARVD